MFEQWMKNVAVKFLNSLLLQAHVCQHVGATLGSVKPSLPSAPSLLNSGVPSPGISERSLVPTQLIQLVKSLTSNESGGSCLVLFLPPYLFNPLALIPSGLNHHSLAATFSLSLSHSSTHFGTIFSPSVLFPLYFSQDFFIFYHILSLSSAQDRCCLLRFLISRLLPHCLTVLAYLVFTFVWTRMGFSCHHLTFAVHV